MEIIPITKIKKNIAGQYVYIADKLKKGTYPNKHPRII